MPKELIVYDFDSAIEMIQENARQAKLMGPGDAEALLQRTEEHLARLPAPRPAAELEANFQAILSKFDKLEACFKRMIRRVDAMIEISQENRAILARIEAKAGRLFGPPPSAPGTRE